MMSNIEKAFDMFVEQFGGTPVRKLVGSSPPFENADYVFEKYRAIAELKCLEDDKFGDAKFVEKASAIYLEALQKGGTRVVVSGKRAVPSDAFTPEYQERLVKLYEQPVRNVIKKANRQIRETRNRLGKGAYDGVLLLINSGNLALDPAHVVGLLDRILSRGSYSSIDYAIFFTVNLTASVSSGDEKYMVWVPLYKRRAGNENFSQFEAALRKSWQEHLESNLGMQIPFRTVEPDFLRCLINRRGDV